MQYEGEKCLYRVAAKHQVEGSDGAAIRTKPMHTRIYGASKQASKKGGSEGQ